MNDFDTLGKMLQDEGFQPRWLRGGAADLADDAWSLGLSNHPDHLGWEILVGIEEFPREGVSLFLRKFDEEEGAWELREDIKGSQVDSSNCDHVDHKIKKIRWLKS